MITYRVIAQHYTQDRRISKCIDAASSDDVLLAVSRQLEEFGFYVISIKPASSTP